MVLVIAAIVAAVIGSRAGSGPPAGSHRAARPHRANGRPSPVSGHVRAPTRSPDLIQPTTLATLPDGHLLILDSSRDQILELSADGALSVFAGTGRLGFTGDGGPARDAELHFRYFSSAGMAVTPEGSVDFLDDANCRIRQVDPAGISRTILRVPGVRAEGGTACDLTSVAVSPSGQVYVATDSEVDRLARDGHLVRVLGTRRPEVREPARLTASSVYVTPMSIAFDRAGDLYVGSFAPKAVYRLTPAGRLTDLGASYLTQLSPYRAGTVLVGTHFGAIQQTTPTGLHLYDSVNPRRVTGLDWGGGSGFQENGITVSRHGTIYVDSAEGDGFGPGTVLVSISPTKHASLVPVRTPLAATLPRVGAPGFPATLYPATRRSHGAALASCPSPAGLERFSPQAIVRARAIARTYLSGQFASDITVTDRSGWVEDFHALAGGDDLGHHTVIRAAPTSRDPVATGLAHACGRELVRDSLSVTVGRSAYSTFSGTLVFLDRRGHPLVYDVR